MQTDVRGAGLGLRRALLTELQASLVTGTAPDFFELAPENWLDVGGKFALALENLRAQRPLVAHGLSLSLGGIDALDGEHLHAIKAFLARWEISIYSEHLSASAIHGHLYDLAPIAFTEDMLAHLCERIQRTQAFLGRRIAVENSSYYLSLAASMSIVVYHVVNLMPEGINNRKRHVGNDNILIVFVDKDSPVAVDADLADAEQDQSLVSGDFGFLTIYVTVLPDPELLRVTVRVRRGMPTDLREELVPFVGDDIVVFQDAPAYVRSLAIRADIACRSILDNLAPASNCHERYRILREMSRHVIKQ